MALIAQSLAAFLQIYLVLLFIRVLLSWFPNISWYNPPFSFLSQVTDPYLNLFRSIIPPLGGIDFSPMLGFFALSIASQLLGSVANSSLVSYLN
jgi:YggT family protein